LNACDVDQHLGCGVFHRDAPEDGGSVVGDGDADVVRVGHLRVGGRDNLVMMMVMIMMVMMMMWIMIMMIMMDDESDDNDYHDDMLYMITSSIYNSYYRLLSVYKL